MGGTLNGHVGPAGCWMMASLSRASVSCLLVLKSTEALKEAQLDAANQAISGIGVSLLLLQWTCRLANLTAGLAGRSRAGPPQDSLHKSQYLKPPQPAVAQ